MRQVRISEIVIDKYLQVFNNRRIKHIILTSGRAGTKSSFAAIRGDFTLVSDPDASVIVLRKRHNKLRKTVYKEMLRGINRLGIPKSKFLITKSPMEITYLKTGATMYFAGSDGIDDTKGIIDEEHPIKLVILDELTEFFDDGEGADELQNIEATFVRGNRSGFQMIYLYNPPKNPNAAINKWCREMEQRDDVIHIHTDYRDVPAEWLGDDLIASAEALKRADERQYRWVWLGVPVGIDEAIYYMFSDRHKEKPLGDRTFKTCYIGGDYGQLNATTYEAFLLDTYERRLRGCGEFYHSGRDSGKQKTPAEYAMEAIRLMEDVHEKYGATVFYMYLDPSAAGLMEEVRRKVRDLSLPFAVHLKKAENDVALGISRVQKCLTYDILKIAPAQKNAIDEFGTYEYDKKSIEKGKEVPVKENDHCMDAIRYMVMGAWSKVKRWLPETEKEEEWMNPLDREEEDDDF